MVLVGEYLALWLMYSVGAKKNEGSKAFEELETKTFKSKFLTIYVSLGFV